MPKHDVTKTNLAIEKLLEVTTNPRHRFLLMAFYRHRYLEISGRNEEIFARKMMSERATYHMHIGETNATLAGNDRIKGLYRMWAETNQCIFYAERRGGCRRGPLHRHHHFGLSAGFGEVAEAGRGVVPPVACYGRSNPQKSACPR